MIRGFTIVLSLTLVASLTPAESGEAIGASETVEAYAYHVRLVRIGMNPEDPGAAVGLGADSGTPVVVPSDEVWGTPEQLEGLRSLLGVATAEPVTGFFLQPRDAQEYFLERRIYLGDTVADLSFRARPPANDTRAHRVELSLTEVAAPEPPLAEATLLLATERTVAIVIPGLPDGDGLVLAVTSLAPAETAERLRGAESVRLIEGDVQPPRLIDKTNPRYPENARKSRLEGEVILQVMLDREGVPRAPMVLRMSPGCEELAGAAVEAVHQWRYEPARIGDEPVAVWFTVVVKFELE